MSSRRPGKRATAPVPATYRLHGIEVFPGVGTPLSRTTRYGATFVATERGKRLVVLIGWLNYSPIFFKPFTDCSVVGGRWWMVTFEKMRPRVLLRGSFERGRVRWNRNTKLAEASVRLKPLGENRTTGELQAILNHHPFPPSPPRISGTLKLFKQNSGPDAPPIGQR